MEASRISISQELQSSDLSQEQKVKLRTERALEFIRSKPNGPTLKTADFVPVLGMNQGNCAKFLAKLEQDGKIGRESVGHKKYAYYIREAEWRDPAIKVTPLARTDQQTDQSLVERLAHQYFWETQDDSVHGFVEWLGKQQ